MNVPPGQPAPMYAPPPPPPKKSGALKWILIGCGGVGFIGLIVCGGCGIWIINFGKSVIKVHEEVEAMVKASPEVREDIGEVQEVEPEDDQSSKKATEIVLRFTVKGEKGTGLAKAKVKFSFTGFTLESVTYETKDGRTVKLK
jgi:hypothetical protein